MLNYKIYSQDKKISFKRPIIIFLHGFGGNSSIWFKQIKPLKQKYDLVCIDLPSHGKNNLKLSNLKNNFQEVTNSILEVLKFLKIEKANFIGCSIGTTFIKYILLTKSEIVDKFILIGCVGNFRNWFKNGIYIAKNLLNIFPKNICCNLVSKLLIPNKKYNESRLLFLECAKKISKKELKSWLKLILKFPKINKDFLKNMKNFKNGLYIMGKEDNVFLDSIKEEKEYFNNIKILENCGHICNIDKYKEVNDIILDFI